MSGALTMRIASENDISDIRALLADDYLGKTREVDGAESLEKYVNAFAAIQASPDNELWVGEIDGEIVGTYQVTYIPYLSRGGNLRCLIEAVRTQSNRRGQGIGKQMMEFALEQAKQRGCGMAQLTTDKSRADAHRFYERLGFKNTHEGMKFQF